MKHSWVFLSSFLLFLLVLACRPESPGPVKEPCEDASPFTANFQILEMVGDSLIETDQVLMFNRVQFRSRRRYRSYTWKIGEDQRVFTDPTVTLRFDKDALGPITVTLIATTNESNSCFPDDNKIDTLTKTFTVISWDKAPITGEYVGTFGQEPTEKQVVEVRYISPFENVRYEPYGGFELININKGCNLDVKPTVWGELDRGAYAMYFDGYGTYHDGCLGPMAWLRLYGKDSLLVRFSTGTLDSKERTSDIFFGVRR